ncbi:nucleotide-diphospho-sugar transferase [Pelagophyceae sp. CCMP2097]|nr:nucleotide-diphospho-sugar transferase [Pelagophyceae sp. CCMP2097]
MPARHGGAPRPRRARCLAATAVLAATAGFWRALAALASAARRDSPAAFRGRGVPRDVLPEAPPQLDGFVAAPCVWDALGPEALASRRARPSTTVLDFPLAYAAAAPRPRCAFVTLVQRKAVKGAYAMLAHSARQVDVAFDVAGRGYPHIFFHERDLPSAHLAHLRAVLPARAAFVDVSPLFSTPPWTPPEADWVAVDRSRSYKHMCRFFAITAWPLLAAMGVDAVLRVDDDVLLFAVAARYDPFEWLYTSGTVYAYGAAVQEDHKETVESLGKWLFEFCLAVDWTAIAQGRGCKQVQDIIFREMFYNNLMLSRVSFWLGRDVQRLLWELDRTSNIYTQRWGDAPLQSAAVRLYAPPDAVRRLPGQLAYLHASGGDYFFDGERIV